MTDFLNELNPAQRNAVEAINGPVMVLAGAGSGKTRVLTYRIAYLLELGVDPFNILSLTFTNKAAKEMKERIEKIAGTETRNLWMGTFHPVFARILRSEASLIGYPYNFTIYDTIDAKSLLKGIIKELKRHKIRLMKIEEQQEEENDSPTYTGENEEVSAKSPEESQSNDNKEQS